MTLEERKADFERQREELMRRAQSDIDRLTGAILLLEQLIAERDAPAAITAERPSNA